MNYQTPGSNLRIKGFFKKIGEKEITLGLTEKTENYSTSENRSKNQENVWNTNQERMIIEEKITNLELRQRLPTIRDQYKFLVDEKKLYLPKWKILRNRPKCITEKYLLGILMGQIFSIKEDKIKKPKDITKNLTKLELQKILEGLVDKPLGFEIDREPDRKWLVKVIYSLSPNNEVFQSTEQELGKLLPKE